MSRRNTPADDTHKSFVMVRLSCAHGHRVGRVVRQRGRDMLESPLERLDGANGETTIRARCPACSAAGRSVDAQMRWDRISTMLDELEAAYKPGTDIANVRDLRMS